MNSKKNNFWGTLKSALFENKVIVLFVVLCVACIMIADTSVSYIASEVFARFARNACLVLALIIPCLAGLGMNFGIVVGAIAAQISIIMVLHWGLEGVPAFALCALISVPLAILFGYLIGVLYNKTKGAEMVAGLVLGFFAAGLYRLLTLFIIGGVIPFDDPHLLERGFGLKNAYDLSGNLKYALDDISFLTVLLIIGVLYLVMAIVTAVHSKIVKKPVETKSLIQNLVIGAVLVVFAIVANMVPGLKTLFGGTRLVLTDVALFGGIAAIVYAIAMFVVKRPGKSEKAFKNYIVIAVVGALLLVGTVVPSVRAIYQAIKLPAATYGIICLFCFFNNWILNTRLGQNMRTVGQSLTVATSAGINVDKIRIIATCISTVLAAWGQLIFLQNLGTFSTVTQQDNVGLYAVAAILVGGATVQKASNKHALVGVVLFHMLFVVAPLAATKLVGDSAVSEYIRMFISYGVIAVSLAMHAWNKVKKPSGESQGRSIWAMRPFSGGGGGNA